MRIMNYAVIGANYGDEGKGRVVDYFAKKNSENNVSSLVVRFSGSNNAGHTVYIDENNNNVFHLLGSGSYRKVPTYLSKYVYVDIVMLDKEIKQFYTKTGISNTVFVDPRCKIVLPYDVAINQIKEFLRDKNRHGSTGNGLSEAVNRAEFYPITVGEIGSSLETMKKIHTRFVKFVNDLKPYELEKVMTLFDHNGNLSFCLLEKSVEIFYKKMCSIIDDSDNIVVGIPSLHNFSCIFEGSQGLLLDEYSSNFPYVTRGRTGSHNLIDLCREFEIYINEIYYVSRLYLTRHGSDPNFTDNTQEVFEYFDIVDTTNVTNMWQGSMKYDHLLIDDLISRCEEDFEQYNKHYQLSKMKYVITCVDQQKEKVIMKFNENITSYYDVKTTFNMFPEIKNNVIFFDSKYN